MMIAWLVTVTTLPEVRRPSVHNAPPVLCVYYMLDQRMEGHLCPYCGPARVATHASDTIVNSIVILVVTSSLLA